MKKRVLAWCLALCMGMGLLPAAALAADTGLSITGSSEVTADENGTWTLTGGSYTVSGTALAGESIVIRGNVELTLNGVTIIGRDKPISVPLPEDGYSPAISIESGSASLILASETTNKLRGDPGKAGIYVAEGAEVTISGSGTLTATGGDLTALSKIVNNAWAGLYCGGGAGIGGNGVCIDIETGEWLEGSSVSFGTITILSGTITATVDQTNKHSNLGSGAGIGTGGGSGQSNNNSVWRKYSGKIDIRGGTIRASSYLDNQPGGAGIGTGGHTKDNWDVHNRVEISISGDDTVVYAYGGGNAAGIGGGNCVPNYKTTISGGKVLAVGGHDNGISGISVIYGGSGIGSGDGGETAGTITINGNAEVCAIAPYGNRQAIGDSDGEGSLSVAGNAKVLMANGTNSTQMPFLGLSNAGIGASVTLNRIYAVWAEGTLGAGELTDNSDDTFTAQKTDSSLSIYKNDENTEIVSFDLPAELSGATVASWAAFFPGYKSPYDKLVDAVQGADTENGTLTKIVASELAGSDELIDFGAGTLTIPTGANIELDLSGCTLQGSGKADMITVSSGAELKITDSSADSSGAVAFTSKQTAKSAIKSSGTLTVAGGAISANGSVANAYGINVNGGEVNIEGGVVSASANTNAYGVFGNSTSAVTNITGGTVNANGKTNSYGVSCKGTVTLSGNGKISVNASASNTGYGLYVNSGCTVSVTGGSIAVEAKTANCIYNYSGTTEVTGGTFAATGTNKRGLYNSSGTATLTNVDMSGCAVANAGTTAKITINSGTYGAVSNAASNVNSKVTINGGTFESLTATNKGGYTITGGSFETLAAPTGAGTYTITGGDFKEDPTAYLADGYGIVINSDNNRYYVYKTHTVTFETDGGSVEPATKEVIPGGEYGELPVPTRTGYTFDGWFTDRTGGTEIRADTTAELTGAVTLYAHWTPIVYTVTFVAEGSTVGTRTYTVENLHIDNVPKVPAKLGYDGVWETYALTAGDVTVNAVYTQRGTHIVNFVSDGTTIHTLTDVLDGATVTAPADPTKAGYTFVGWFKGETEWDFATAITEDITLTAKWEMIWYPSYEPVTPVTPTTPVEPDKPGKHPFVDVPDGEWYSDGVQYVYTNGIMKGVNETGTVFDLNGSTSRAMLMTMLARLDGVDTSVGATWDEIGMNWAVATGISDGTDGTRSISRQELVTMLYRYAGSPAVSDSALAALGRYSDYSALANWAQYAMAWAVEKGIINGIDGALSPAGTASRAEVATILMRFCEAIGE